MQAYCHGELSGREPVKQAPDYDTLGARIRVSAVVEVDEQNSEEASRLSNSFMALLNRAVYHKTAVAPEVLGFQAGTSRRLNPSAEPLPLFRDEALSRLSFPVQFFGGDHDALIDSEKTAQRLKSLLPHAEVHVLKDTGHVIIDKFQDAAAFLKAAAM